MIDADVVRKVRQNLGLTQVQFAELLAVNSRTVSRWENREAYPNRDQAQLIHTLTQIDMNDVKYQNQSTGSEALKKALVAVGAAGCLYILFRALFKNKI